MTALSKALLASSVTGIISGSILDFGRFNINPAWTVLLPFGAVAYGLFMISFMLESEMAKFNAEESKRAHVIEDYFAIP